VTRGRAAYETARRLSTGVEVVNALVGRAQVEANAGFAGEARRYLAQAESLARAFHPAPLHTAVYFAGVYARLGDREHALRWLRAYTPREDLHFQLHLRCDPPLDLLARDPRFQDLIVKTAANPRGTCLDRRPA